MSQVAAANALRAILATKALAFIDACVAWEAHIALLHDPERHTAENSEGLGQETDRLGLLLRDTRTELQAAADAYREFGGR